MPHVDQFGPVVVVIVFVLITDDELFRFWSSEWSLAEIDHDELVVANGDDNDDDDDDENVVVVVVVVVELDDDDDEEGDDEEQFERSLLLFGDDGNEEHWAYFSLRRSTYHTSSQFLTMPFSKRIGS